MKKFIVLLSFLFLCVTINAQSKLVDEIKEIPWELTGEEIKSHYQKTDRLLEFRGDSLAPQSLLLKNISIDEFLFEESVEIDVEERKIKEVRFRCKVDTSLYTTEHVCQIIREKLKQELGTAPSGYLGYQWLIDDCWVYVFELSTIGLVSIVVEPTIDCIQGFRSFDWGTSFDTIVSNERKTDLVPNDDNIYAFKAKLAEKNCLVGYYFLDNKLTEGRYVLNENYNNVQSYISDYEEWVDILTAKYGKPSNVETRWVDNESEKRYKFKESKALERGKVEFVTSWSDHLSMIIVTLSKEENNISLVLDYCSWKYYYIRQQNRYVGF